MIYEVMFVVDHGDKSSSNYNISIDMSLENETSVALEVFWREISKYMSDKCIYSTGCMGVHIKDVRPIGEVINFIKAN